MGVTRILAIVTLSLLGLSGLACGDTVRTTDGVYEGSITEVSDAVIVLELSDRKIKRFKRDQVVSFSFGDSTPPANKPVDNPRETKPAPSPPAGATPPASAGSVSATKDASQGPPTWMMIPIVGKFGKEVNAAGIAAALADAKGRQIKHIVFYIDSPGGSVVDAVAITKALDDFRANFKYHSVVKRAMSAAVWVLLSSDTIWMSRGSDAGAAVMYTHDINTGEINVDAKLNAARASQLAAMADAHGHSGILVRAMIVREAEAWLSTGTDGKPVVTDAQPAVGTSKLIDTNTTILSMTGTQAIEYGFARSLPQPIPDLVGPALGIVDWRSSKNAGTVHVAQASMEVSRLQRDIDASEREYKAALSRIDAAVAAVRRKKTETSSMDPARLRLGYDTRTGELTAESLAAWVRQTDLAIGCWSQVEQSLFEADAARRDASSFANRWVSDTVKLNKFRRIGTEAPPAPPIPDLPFDLNSEWQAAEREIERLRNNRNRRTI